MNIGGIWKLGIFHFLSSPRPSFPSLTHFANRAATTPLCSLLAPPSLHPLCLHHRGSARPLLLPRHTPHTAWPLACYCTPVRHRGLVAGLIPAHCRPAAEGYFLNFWFLVILFSEWVNLFIYSFNLG
jgi:hypothetical protein